ncbi:TetR/AcrR family transcriptional regulator [Streptomyces sp. Je 1-4]|uniref:TetR/AcrR family transcriptional regulator n=1 Tax=Streptomyces TaxID=1883 RepID=UPI0021DB0316|nr:MULTISPECIES: TetR/AcrR family transcriptional regulator [unclassified Streptomyces]UYB44672.1 TetR/AcrR family transcriptional regulator [Streptomyces sp. Je 1-4]UZQ34802.1 TetR/AcrR family transcriptional regulator [Streptomyces sp. Je 1-4] [Streptomyces sp. Je 1-4 4N24]UZQ42220.1 TetR/AcrR family transcriptional regulator [Streptomyces sp. Je 1-4] [Streptomyces sp. Je 1-4 4N24_ara]
MGRRERKKAATRQALADAALRLFLERGYDQVSIRDIAEAADVSTTTLFKHFPGKEALVFDADSDHEAALVAAVRERPDGRSLPAALRDHILRSHLETLADPAFARFRELVTSTPALRDYGHRMWMRHETALAQAIAADIGAPEDDPACAALAHFALEASALARDQDDPRAAVDAAFDLLERGWHPPTRRPARGPRQGTV